MNAANRRALPPGRRSLAAYAIGACAALLGCDANPDAGHHHDGESADMASADAAATPPVPVQIGWKARVGTAPFACGQKYPGIGAGAGTPIEGADFRLYVHDVRLVDHAGAEHPVTLDEDNLWQHAGVALLDFEDKTGACTGTKEVRTHVRGTVSASAHPWKGVRFKIGVPFAMNHADVATAPSPLNLSSMFWSWQGGYKFIRIEGQNAAGQGFLLHLGSTGCMKDGTGAVTACSSPNRPDVTLDGFDPAQQVIVADLATLFAGTDLTAAVECMSGPATPDCPPLFSRLGLPYGTAPASVQQFFRIE